MWSAHKRIEKLRYLHRNPVKREGAVVGQAESRFLDSSVAVAPAAPGMTNLLGEAVLPAHTEA